MHKANKKHIRYRKTEFISFERLGEFFLIKKVPTPRREKRYSSNLNRIFKWHQNAAWKRGSIETVRKREEQHLQVGKVAISLLVESIFITETIQDAGE